MELGRKITETVEKLGMILSKAGLLEEHNEVIACEAERIGEHGYQGLLYRIKDIQLGVPQPELQQSYILKLGEVTTDSVDVLKEAKFHQYVGNLYTNPNIPRVYLATQS